MFLFSLCPYPQFWFIDSGLQSPKQAFQKLETQMTQPKPRGGGGSRVRTRCTKTEKAKTQRFNSASMGTSKVHKEEREAHMSLLELRGRKWVEALTLRPRPDLDARAGNVAQNHSVFSEQSHPSSVNTVNLRDATLFEDMESMRRICEWLNALCFLLGISLSCLWERHNTLINVRALRCLTGSMGESRSFSPFRVWSYEENKTQVV